MTDADQTLCHRIREGLNCRGYHYEPSFPGDPEGRHVVALARELGTLYVPAGLLQEHPVVVTRPSEEAPLWRPFDRLEGIGWHNDFSTLRHRPHLSLIWISKADPGGETKGAWRVASVSDVIAHIESLPDGLALLRRMRSEPLPFGYQGSDPEFLPLLERGEDGEDGLRFYRRALFEGAQAASGEIPESVRHMVELIVGAADAVGTTLPAREGALLVADNRRALHDRTAQSAEGRYLRRSILCFVDRLA